MKDIKINKKNINNNQEENMKTTFIFIYLKKIN